MRATGTSGVTRFNAAATRTVLVVALSCGGLAARSNGGTSSPTTARSASSSEPAATSADAPAATTPAPSQSGSLEATLRDAISRCTPTGDYACDDPTVAAFCDGFAADVLGTPSVGRTIYSSSQFPNSAIAVCEFGSGGTKYSVNVAYGLDATAPYLNDYGVLVEQTDVEAACSTSNGIAPSEEDSYQYYVCLQDGGRIGLGKLAADRGRVTYFNGNVQLSIGATGVSGLDALATIASRLVDIVGLDTDGIDPIAAARAESGG